MSIAQLKMMTNSLIELNKYRKHVVIDDEQNGLVHVIPLITLEHIANNVIDITELEAFEELIPVIVKEYLKTLNE